MNSLNTEQTLELLRQLRNVVRDFAAREEEIEKEFRAKTAAVNQRRDKGAEAIARQLSAEIEKTDSHFTQVKADVEKRYQQRKTRIVRARAASQKQALEKIDYIEGCRKHKLQTEMIKATKSHKTGLENTEHVHEEFKKNLAAENVVLLRLEEKTKRAFQGHGKFRRLLSPKETSESMGADENELIQELRELRDQSRQQLKYFCWLPLPFFFRFRALWLLLVFAQIPLVPLLHHFGDTRFSYQDAMLSVVGCLLAGFVLHQLGQLHARSRAKALAATLVRARQTHDTALVKCEARFKTETARIENEFKTQSKTIDEEWNLTLSEASEARETFPREIDERAARVAQETERIFAAQKQRLQAAHEDTLQRIKTETDNRRQELTKGCEQEAARLTAERQAKMEVLATEWNRQVPPLFETVAAANLASKKLFPEWSPDFLQSWQPPIKSEHVAKFGQLEIDVARLCESLPKNVKLSLPATQFSVPLLLRYPEQGSLLLETTGSGHEAAISVLNTIVLRLLANAAPGRVNFTIIDPVGLGQNFAGVMHLADYADYLVNSRIWTQPAQIEEKLAELNEHMEKVIQMYLRNEYATIAQYNEEAGNIAEKYHFLVIADFPVNFTETAVRRLHSIVASGARCGVYTLIHWDRRQPLLPGFTPDEWRQSSVAVQCGGNQFNLMGKSLPGTNLELDTAPSPDFAIDFVHQVGKASRDSNRVEVPFSHIAPSDEELWSAETTSELRVAIGRTGATKLQYLAIGKGTRQHALLAGKTGSGKSTLFHVIITNLALWCSPEQVEFYLVDFKKGVEFKCYAAKRLPHARVVAIESDREFGLSVLQRLDEELKRRGELFRHLGVQDLAGYKRAGGSEPLPRSLLMIDEFQEFFVEDDQISQQASVLLDRIVRQGRAFGIHVLLGSQTLGGAYTVARATLGQMVVRIALQCNEADAYLIMDDNNPAPRLLSRPGEGIYNDAAGAKENNSPFQAVWLPDEARDFYLEKVRLRAEQSTIHFPAPVVYEGDAPGDVRENAALQKLLEAEAIQSSAAARIWLGAPNAIKGPTEAVFQRQSGNHLLIVGQRDDAILAMFSTALMALAAQYPAGKARFILCESTAPGSSPRNLLEQIVRAIPHPINWVKNSDLDEIMNQLAADLKQRLENREENEAPATFLFIHGLPKFSKLRYEEDFSFSSDEAVTKNPASHLNKLICEGASLGFHVIASCDSHNNVNRFLSKKALSEFGMRVLFQMSASDSASLIDSTKAASLGLHRALFYNEQQGHLELFRPYAFPDRQWIEKAGRNLSRMALS